MEQWSDMYTVTSQLLLKVKREDDGVPVVCQVDHPAVKDLQTKYYLDVMCEYQDHKLFTLCLCCLCLAFLKWIFRVLNVSLKLFLQFFHVSFEKVLPFIFG